MFNVFRANWRFRTAKHLASDGRLQEAFTVARAAWSLLEGYRGRWRAWSVGRLSLVVTVSVLVDELASEDRGDFDLAAVLREARRMVNDAADALPELGNWNVINDYLSWADHRLSAIARIGQAADEAKSGE